MTPDQIKQAIESSFPTIRSKPRRNPDGWAFYLGEIREGPHSTRIARAVQKTPAAATKFKLAVTSRAKNGEAVHEVHTARQVQELVTEEIRLWHLHFWSISLRCLTRACSRRAAGGAGRSVCGTLLERAKERRIVRAPAVSPAADAQAVRQPHQ